MRLNFLDAQTLHQQTNHKRKRSQFGHRADEHRNRGRRAVIHIRQPHMKRRCAQLETDTRGQKHQAEYQHHVFRAVIGNHRGDAGDFQRAGGAVNHRHPVEQHAGSQCAQHEIFHRRFGGDTGFALQCDHRVKRKAEQLKTQIQGEQMIRRDHHHQAQRGE